MFMFNKGIETKIQLMRGVMAWIGPLHHDFKSKDFSQ